MLIIEPGRFYMMGIRPGSDRLVILSITETDPGVRGDTASGATKPATVETGAVIKVPLFVDQGEMVRIDTRTGEYVSRAKD